MEIPAFADFPKISLSRKKKIRLGIYRTSGNPRNPTLGEMLKAVKDEGGDEKSTFLTLYYDHVEDKSSPHGYSYFWFMDVNIKGLETDKEHEARYNKLIRELEKAENARKKVLEELRGE